MKESSTTPTSILGRLRWNWVSVVAVVLVVLGGAATAYGWAVASPSGASPDDDFHMASIWCPTPVDQACQLDKDENGQTVVVVPKEVAASAGCFAFDPNKSAGCVLEMAGETGATTRFDTGLYPGGYYDIMHIFSSDHVYSSVVSIRLINAGLAVGLLGAAALLGSKANRRLMIYSILPVSVPFMVYLVASVNPSSWAITGVAVAWFATCSAVLAKVRWRLIASGVLAGVGAAMAAVARADAGAYIVLISLASVVLLFNHYRQHRWRFVIPVATAVIGFIGFWSARQNGSLGSGMDGKGHIGDIGLLMYNLMNIEKMYVDYSGLWFGLNWIDTPMPSIVSISVLAASLGVLFVGLRRFGVNKGLAFGGVLFVYVVLPLWILQMGGTRVGGEVQPRYILPLVAILWCLALWWGKRGGAPRLSLPQTILVYVCVVVAHAVALHTQIRRFVTGTDVAAFNLDYQVEWWHAGPMPMATWILASLGFAAFAAIIFVVRRSQYDAPTELDEVDNLDLPQDLDSSAAVGRRAMPAAA
ncbi:MAG: DUF2142 domain-containing protein [Propionibacteriaceae bacterium]|jgi:hypothetical protein|nr:DUF2142 domain-containing protein [Propionibacteriaceae bacterium]